MSTPKGPLKLTESCTPARNTIADMSVDKTPTPKSTRSGSGSANWSTPASTKQASGNGGGYRIRSRLNLMQQQQTLQLSAQLSQSSNKSQSRSNPFEASPMTSIDRLKMPIMSPSVFNTIQSPSQEDCSGSFWTLEQRAELFPADISEGSPFKQDTTAMSFLSPNTESRTQEAIDMYFSQHHHTIKSPEDSLSHPRPVALLSSTVAPGHSNMEMCNGSDSGEASPMSSSIHVQAVSNEPCGPVSQYTQTILTLPPQLPTEVEEALKPFFTFNEIQDLQPKNRLERLVSSESGSSHNSVLGNQEPQPNNLSTSTLRRKLFDDVSDKSDEEIESPIETPSDPPQRLSSPLQSTFLSPNQVKLQMHTPVNRPERAEYAKTPTWSSSPIRSPSRRGSNTPPQDLRSPHFSPISDSRL